MISLLALTMSATTPEPASRTDRMFLSTYAHCITEQRPDAARKAVLEDWDSRSLVFRDLLRGEGCAVRGMRYQFPAGVLKAAMAGALIPRDLGSVDAATITSAPALSYTMPEPVKTVDDKGRPISAKGVERQQKAVEGKLRWIAIAQFGKCVARLAPAAVPVLANTITASDAELEALKAFAPHLPGCLPKGMTIELDRSTLRGAVTLAYYRLAMAPRPTTAQEAAK